MTIRLAALAVAAGAVPAAPPASAGTGATQRALDELVAAETGPVGASALIQRGPTVEFLRAVAADLRTGRAFHRSDHMRIASVAKAFSGAVALSLVDRGTSSSTTPSRRCSPAHPRSGQRQLPRLHAARRDLEGRPCSVVVTVNQAHAGEPTPVFQRVLETYELAACFALSGRG